MLAAIAMMMASAPIATPCAGIMLHDRGRATCAPLPPLVDACRAVRTCAGGGVCAITVTGRVDRAAFESGEAWGDWHDRLLRAPANMQLSAATVIRLNGKPLASPPYTVILNRDRPPLVADGLLLDPLEWLAAYAAGGPAPDGLRPAPVDVATRTCPRQPSRRATSRAK